VVLGGSGSITVPSGLFISSQATNVGSASVTGPITIASPGNATGLGSSIVTDIGDSGLFLDPYRDIPQPVLPSGNVLAASLPTYGVVSGNPSNGVYMLATGTTTLAAAISPPYPSGNYVSITCGMPCVPGGTASVSSAQITISTSTTFSDSNPTCFPTSTSNFGCFFFYGGVSIASGAKMTVGAGEFVMVGGGTSGVDFNAPSSAYLDSQVTCTNPSTCSTAGVILIMTGSSSAFTCSLTACTGNANGDLYSPALLAQISSNPVLIQAAVANILTFGSVSLLAGADSTSAAVTGVVAKNLPSSLLTNLNYTLAPFDGVVLWQDQANSTITYTSTGNISVCGVNINYPCTKSLSASTAMTLQAATGTGIQGIVYQPRGAYLQTGGGTVQGPIQIITGAISLGGGSASLTMPPTGAKRRVVTLVE
jgi:hypothetical protein